MKQNKNAFRPAITGPCSASPVHISFGAAHSNRPKTSGGLPSGRAPQFQPLEVPLQRPHRR